MAFFRNPEKIIFSGILREGHRHLDVLLSGLRLSLLPTSARGVLLETTEETQKLSSREGQNFRYGQGQDGLD